MARVEAGPRLPISGRQRTPILPVASPTGDVSSRSPATSMYTWPLLAYTLIHLPLPAAPQCASAPETSGEASSDAPISANDTEPEQS